MKKALYIFLLCSIIYSCVTPKNMPEGQYLLKNVDIKSDDKRIDDVEMESYLRQLPNSSLSFLGRIRLGIYNMAGQDSSKWLTRTIRKIGEAPVYYSPGLTNISAKQIQRQLSNQGFLNAEVDTVLNVKDKNISVTYNITAKEPYTIRKYELDSAQIPKQMMRVLSMYNRRRSSVRPGELFDQDKLEDERVSLTSLFRNIGYYSFSKEYLYYKADTTLNSNQVDLYLSLYPEKDSLAFRRYNVRTVTIKSGFDPMSEDNNVVFSPENTDTTSYRGMTIIKGSNNFLRNSTLYRNTLLRPGRRYSDWLYSNTFTAFNGMSAVKQTNINITPSPPLPTDTTKMLDVNITLAPANAHWTQLSLEGTNSAGDLGVAPSVSYQHQNLFNGGEILSLKLKGAYEFVTKSKNSAAFNNYYEYGFDIGLSFPQFLFPFLKKSWREQPSSSTQFSVGLNNQHRSEYIRQFFNATITYRWSTMRNRLSHSLDFLDINYVRMPWISDQFKNDYLSDSAANSNPMLKAMYQDQLISRSGYSLVYNWNDRSGRVVRNSYTLRFGADIAGVLPRLVSLIHSQKKNDLGQQMILGIAYAEYVKGDVSFSQTHTFRNRNSLAYRAAIGVASPYGNSTVLPFEKRYFGGGSNSVRGWSTRRLGPGSYKSNKQMDDFVNQTGDIKLDLNLEYRAKASDFIEFAGFVDAGNIWTIRNYESQPGGQFKFSEFWREIAMSYGLGIRFDLSFLLLRLDFGMKAYDPERDTNDRWVIYRPNFGRDFAWHFAIGYPF
ncbi:hypothetical protein D0T56_09980 [Dysgonomonas sp. 520]|nr:hypothetical protein [Dysgonomonas sp. 520]